MDLDSIGYSVRRNHTTNNGCVTVHVDNDVVELQRANGTRPGLIGPDEVLAGVDLRVAIRVDVSFSFDSPECLDIGRHHRTRKLLLKLLDLTNRVRCPCWTC